MHALVACTAPMTVPASSPDAPAWPNNLSRPPSKLVRSQDVGVGGRVHASHLRCAVQRIPRVGDHACLPFLLLRPPNQEGRDAVPGMRPYARLPCGGQPCTFLLSFLVRPSIRTGRQRGAWHGAPMMHACPAGASPAHSCLLRSNQRHERTKDPRTHTHTHTHAHARTHARTHAVRPPLSWTGK